MNHLHTERIIHCDLSARNLLVLLNNDVCIVKISDLGMSVLLPSTEDSMTSYRGNFPVRWSSPELLKFGTISKATDIWSYGIVIWEMIELRKPYFEILSNEEVKNGVCNNDLQLEFPSRINNPKLTSLIYECIQYDSLKRPSFQEIINKIKPPEREIMAVEFVDTTGEENYGNTTELVDSTLIRISIEEPYNTQV